MGSFCIKKAFLVWRHSISRWWVNLIVLTCIFSADSLLARGLPEWTAEERAQLKKGTLIPGASLLVGEASTLPDLKIAPEPEVPSIEPVVPESDYDPKVIPEEHLADYFSAESSKNGRFLIDPQRLLSKQESLDREGFLEYHADDSEVDIRMYLFDAQQEIPAPYTLEKLVAERYSNSPLTAIVFCFLGDPTRNVITFGGADAASLSKIEVKKIHDSVKMKALEKSDPSAQVESFIVQLSIKLFWLEKTMIDVKAAATPVSLKARNGAGEKEKSVTQKGSLSKIVPYFLYIIVGLLGTALCFFAIGMGWLLWQRNKSYHFPVMELPRRLEADYAAGVGAVLAFHNKLGSPSSQRDQVPDYLTKM